MITVIKKYYPLLVLVLSFSIFLAVSSCSDSIAPEDSYRIDQTSCIDCGECENVCPYNAIITTGGKPSIIQSKCKECGNCAAICPEDAIN